MTTSLRDQILEADDLPEVDEAVPEWGGLVVRVRGLSGTDRDAYEAKAVALKNQGQDVELRLQDFRTKLVVKCLFDPESDERLFSDKDVAKLGRKSGAVIERLYGSHSAFPA
ncbi:hypothetical protein [Nocardiopsis salina]|uniref:hypothetical protein n=1 Tax=Nocardiopsis salina TaxID=245836 RepID=UPI00034A0D1D|nr:hypothetical protein [Nocardiopsis salina]